MSCVCVCVSVFRLSCLASESQRSACLYLPSSGIKGACHHSWLFIKGLRYPNSDPCVSKATIFLSEHSANPPFWKKNKIIPIIHMILWKTASKLSFFNYRIPVPLCPDEFLAPKWGHHFQVLWQYTHRKCDVGIISVHYWRYVADKWQVDISFNIILTQEASAGCKMNLCELHCLKISVFY